MKKYFKILSILIVLVLISMIGTINVYAQEAMKITKKTTINSGVEGREQRRFYTNKGVAFCITPNRAGMNKPQGCYFSNRCAYCTGLCKKQMPPLMDRGGRKVRCYYTTEELWKKSS